jgi:hypothetical protein
MDYGSILLIINFIASLNLATTLLSSAKELATSYPGMEITS